VSELDAIVEHKRQEVAERRARRPLSALRDRPPPAVRDFAAALRRPGLSAIAEIKRRSPSRGAIRESLDVAEIAGEYAKSEAIALSVLTETSRFGGCDEDLIRARAAVELPVLRKDFTIDEYQIYEARAIGADALLLIVRILSPMQLRDFLAAASAVGVAALVEVHDERELERALDVESSIIGVNNRNLETLRVDLATSLRLRQMIPTGRQAIAESGIETRDDVQRIKDAGYDAMLIGESLLRAASPGGKLRELLGRAT